MTTDNIAYGGSTTISSTFASLASGSARGSAAVDNSSNKFDDAMLTIAVKTSSSAMSGDKACYLYAYGSEDGTVYNSSSAESVGTDAGVTLDAPTNMKLAAVLACAASSTTYRAVVGSIAALFGGVMPKKWGFVLLNSTGQSLDSTEGNHQKTYTGITYTNA